MPADSLLRPPRPCFCSPPPFLFPPFPNPISRSPPAALNLSPLLGLRVFYSPACVGRAGGFSGGCSGTIIKPVFSEFFPSKGMNASCITKLSRISVSRALHRHQIVWVGDLNMLLRSSS